MALRFYKLYVFKHYKILYEFGNNINKNPPKKPNGKQYDIGKKSLAIWCI